MISTSIRIVWGTSFGINFFNKYNAKHIFYFLNPFSLGPSVNQTYIFCRVSSLDTRFQSSFQHDVPKNDLGTPLRTQLDPKSPGSAKYTKNLKIT